MQQHCHYRLAIADCGIPLWNRVDAFIIGIIITLFTIVYAWLILTHFHLSDIQKFNSLDGVMNLFTDRTTVTAGWVHYLAFDLFTGLWIKNNSVKHGISHWIIIPCLLLTFMFGPMGLLLYYLASEKKIKIFSWFIAVTMFIENFIITMQSVMGATSHFNNTSPLNIALVAIMGVIILIFTITRIFIIIAFFRQKISAISGTYLLAIRLGLILFVFFAMEGGAMLANLGHTVGAPDGGPGLPLVN